VVCKNYRDSNCSAVHALNAVGERWSPLIIQDALFNGTTQFSTFETNLEIAPDILSARLTNFVEAGVMELRRNEEVPNQQEYLLTEKGRDLAPMMIALSHWGDRWTEQDGHPVVLEHDGCGGVLEQLIRCEGCGESPSLDHVHARPDTDAEVLKAVLDTHHAVRQEEGIPAAAQVEIFLLGAFGIRIEGESVGPLSAGTQRILAYLAIHERPVTRLAMAGTMWPDVTEQHAGGSLRSALSRLDKPTKGSILMASAGLRLDDGVIVDFREAKALAHRLLEVGTSPSDADLSADAVDVLSMDLLPDWYDDWVVAEADSWRYSRRNCLEALSGFLCAKRRWAEAAQAARAAISVDPLRESPQACLIKVHLATGNQSEALKAYEQYRRRLLDELGLEPTALLSRLVRNIQKL
jgi:DNA-binding HxlR family transcriptional regulator/DNA-binding SARP family transcriptional activator